MSALADRYQAFLLDLDGVVYRGDEPIPGAAEAVAGLRDRGARVVFVTNNSAPTPDQVVDTLASMGVKAETDDVVTSSQAVAAMVRDQVGHGAEVFVVGEEGLRGALQQAGLRLAPPDADGAAAVVVGWDRAADFDRLRRAGLLVQRGARLYAANADRSYPAAGGELWPGTGALLGVIETTTGVRAEVAGKPHRPLFRAALERAGTRSALMVGDRLDTDVAGAAAAGLDAVAVLSGAVTRADLLDHDPLPVDVVPDLSGLLEERPDVAARPAEEGSGMIAALLEEAGLEPVPGGSETVVLGEGVATASVRLREAQAYLHSVAVRADARGLGLGALAVAAASARARAGGARTIWLMTEDAGRFFEGLGFARVDLGDLPAWTEGLTASCAETSVAMRRSLAQNGS